MSDLLVRLRALKRPGLLTRTARLALEGYDRERDLAPLIGAATGVAADRALARLLDAEAEVDSVRRAGHADYSPARHVALLAAIMGEARALVGPRRTDQV